MFWIVFSLLEGFIIISFGCVILLDWLEIRAYEEYMRKKRVMPPENWVIDCYIEKVKTEIREKIEAVFRRK